MVYEFVSERFMNSTNNFAVFYPFNAIWEIILFLVNLVIAQNNKLFMNMSSAL